MASIRKNDNGTYTATVYVGRDSNGKMLRKYVTRDGRKECKDAAREIERQVASMSLTNVSLMRVSGYLDTWLQINKAVLAPTTIKAYTTYINKHFKPHFARLNVHQVTDMHIKEYISLKLKEVSATTVRKHFFTLSKIFRDALKHKSPCIGVKPPQQTRYKPSVPTEDEFNAIRGRFASIGPEHEAIILLAGWCGLRRGEIFALKWDDIDKKNGVIRIDEAVALEEDGYRFEFKAPKSANGIREIAAPDYLITMLLNLKERKVISHEVFTINPHTFTKQYRQVIDESNLARVRFHDLRHYHASLLYDYSVPDQYAAERLGHDIIVLKKIYQHLGKKQKNTLDERVKGLFK